MQLARAIFLDRDNTINLDTGYTSKISEWQFLPGVTKALALLSNAGWLLIVISNQSGIGLGYYDEATLNTLQSHVETILKPFATITAWYHCPHIPGAGCSCRKPQPGLILQAAKDWHIDLGKSWMLGDRLTDALAGLAAGCQAGLITSMLPDPTWPPQIHIWPNLLLAAQDIVNSPSIFQSASRVPR